ncbi:MAG: alpha-galactosidase [Lachnospiraceae bacterium]|nr:alpha-galactosidase [Ruminococcus sp.]MCM1274933.1 alpha-galactosidase [Lachnospiraceae bacterium]
MAIIADKQNNFFGLLTENTEYQMKADKFGVLKHLWYGKRVGSDMEYLLQYPEISFSGSPYEAENDRTYSLNTLPLEYSCEGSGDFRVWALSAEHPDGTRALDLRFKGFEVKKGKYSLTGLPAAYADENEAETLEITLEDAPSGIRVTLLYGVFEKLDVITRAAVITNNGKETVHLERAASLCLDLPRGDWEWVHFHGRHAMERVTERAKLVHGIQESSSARGASSHQQNPTVLLCSPDCTETSGECIGAALMYSGSFSTQIQLDEINQTRLVTGVNPEQFRWELKPNAGFVTPEVILSFSANGLERLSHNFHKTIREHVCRGRYKLAERPVLINNWEATYFGFDEEKICNIAKQAAELGVDMLVLDDGWFGKRDSDCSGLGDWTVNESKLRGGLGKLAERVKSLGMKFGIWFEPEMVSEDSDLYRAHPDWAIKIPSRNPIRSRFQLVLDMTNPEVRDHLFNAVSAILNSADVSYVKWDFNRHITDWYTKTLPPERLGEMPHRYVLGLYELLERLTSAFPNVLFEGCSGGGGRFDAGMLYYTPQIWCSDDTDAFERTLIQYGTSFFYPVSAVGSHVSAVPNHQTGRVTPLESRAAVAMAGSFGYELDLNTLSENEKAAVKGQIRRFKKYGSLIHNGLYYRLSDPFSENFAAWEFASADEALVQGMVFKTVPTSLQYNIKLRGLDPDGQYRLDGTDFTAAGAALMNGGCLLPRTWGDYTSFELHFTRI